MQRLIVLLRLAVVLHRSRSPDPLPPIELKGKPGLLIVQFPKRWLREHALTRADLEEEAEFLRAADIQLKVR